MPQVIQQQPKSEVPVEALRFVAGMTFEQPKGEDGTVPFSTLARTSKPIDHWYWGQCVHDFAGIQMAPVIPVDYAHEDCEALGFIDAKSVTSEGLQLSGKLTPFKPDDKASEVIFKSAKGVPYQASVDFDPWTLVVEDVPAGLSAEVNGQMIPGPVAVFRQWKLNGLAICLYGVDPGTNVSFSKGDLSGTKVAVTRFKKGESMSTTTKPGSAGKFAALTPEEKASLATAAAALTDFVEKSTEAEPAETQETDSTDTGTAADAAPTTEETQMSRKDLGKKFITEFGEQHGPTLFAKGFSFQEAQAEYSKLLKAENDALKAEIAKFKKLPSGTTPVSFSGAGNQEGQTKFAGLTGGAGKFASGIKIPGKK